MHPAASSASRRLLVVDDAPTVLRVMDSVLSAAGYDVTCVERGLEAVEVVRRFRPDLVFLDATLPDIDGAEMCRSLSRIDDSVPVVLMATRADPEAERIRVEPCVVDHITKPFPPDALLALVEHLLAKQRDANVARRPRPEVVEAAVAVPQLSPSRRLATAVAAMLEARARTGLSIAERLEAVFGDADVVEAMSAVVRERPAAPALGGDLAQVPIADVLQALALERQTGILMAERAATLISIVFKNGAVRLVMSENAGREFLLGSILVRERLIAPDELALVLKNRHGARRRLGQQIVQLGYMSEEDLRRVLRRQSSELVYELVRWRSGRFEFRRQRELPADAVELDIDVTVDELLMEGYRRVDEWGLIETVLPSFTVVPVRVPGGVEHVGRLTPEEQEVYNHVDGRRRAQEIIEQARGSAFEIARILYRLISARVITVAPPAGDGATAAGGPVIA